MTLSWHLGGIVREGVNCSRGNVAGAGFFGVRVFFRMGFRGG